MDRGRDPLNINSFKTQNFLSPEDLIQPLYDRGNFAAAGTSEIALFSLPMGSSATLIRAGATGTFTKTLRDTNLEVAGIVPGKEFLVSGMSIGFCHTVEGAVGNPIDREKVRSGGYLIFKTGDKPVFQCPLVYIPEVNPNQIATTTATTTTILGAVGGGGAGMVRFGIPIALKSMQSFSVRMLFDGTIAIAAALDIYCFLHAAMRRPT